MSLWILGGLQNGNATDNPLGRTSEPKLPLGTQARQFVSPANRAKGLDTVTRELIGKPITLADAISIALANSPTIARTVEALNFASGRTKEAAAGDLPTLALSPGESLVRHKVAPAYAVQITLPIDISGLVAAATSQAKFLEIGARLDVNRAVNDVEYGVRRTFYGVLRSEALVKVALENLKESLEALHDANARYDARSVAYIDVIRAQTGVANAQKTEIQAQSQLKSATSDLANAMGVDVTTPLEVSEDGAVEKPKQKVDVLPPTVIPSAPIPKRQQPQADLPDATSKAASALVSDLAKSLQLGPEFGSALNHAMTARPEILEADAYIAAAKRGVVLAKRSEAPSLALGIGYYDLRSTTGTQINEPQGIISLNFPVFDGGLARARREEADAAVASAETARRQEVDRVTLDVQRSYLNVVQAEYQVAVADQAVVGAKAGYEIAKVRYNAGVSAKAGISPLLELGDAQVALQLAEENQVNALYDYNDALAGLDRSSGRLAYQAGTSGYINVPKLALH